MQVQVYINTPITWFHLGHPIIVQNADRVIPAFAIKKAKNEQKSFKKTNSTADNNDQLLIQSKMYM